MIDEGRMREVARDLLASGEVDCVIGYARGSVWYRARPVAISDPDKVDMLIFNPFCMQNLATWLKFEMKENGGLQGKYGVVAKGCAARALIQMMQENGISTDDVYIIGVPCPGMVDPRKLGDDVLAMEDARVTLAGERVVVEGERRKVFSRDDVLHETCLLCRYPTPPLYDVLIGEGIEGRPAEDKNLAHLESLPAEERAKYWEDAFSRCIRCYACRNACPLCYCEGCALECLDPQWVYRSVEVSENTLYHLIRAYHLTGRCVECGSCEFSCPADVPLMELNRKMARDVERMFNYVPGMDPKAKPLLGAYDPRDPEGFIL